jgi:hypothetical protein
MTSRWRLSGTRPVADRGAAYLAGTSRAVGRGWSRGHLLPDYIRFANGSNFEVFGQHSNLDGVNASVVYLGETDDLNQNRVFNNILTRGARANRNGKATRIRVTGVIQGAGLLQQFERRPGFHTTQKWTLYHNLRTGIIDRAVFDLLRASMTKDEWLRNALVLYADGRNYFPSRLRRAA